MLTICVHRYIIESSKGTQEDKTLTKAERNAVNSYKKELIAQGIEKEIAEVMAKSLVETKVIIPVVNY